MPPVPSSSSRGLIAALGAYLVWGVFPLYFLILAPAGPFEIVALRVLLSLVFCAILLTATRGWRRFVGLLRRPRILGVMALAGVLIYVNWQTYVYGVQIGRVLDAALGYFIGPLVTVLLGVVVLHERLRVLQWVAVGISAAALVVIAVGYGEFPVIALTLAVSFSLYGLVKKRVGGAVDAVSGLTLETLVLSPVAIVQLVIVAQTAGIRTGTAGPGQVVLIALAGVITALPLLLFAVAAPRLPLVTVGLVQYITPVVQFVLGVLVLGEQMPPERWVGFGLVWVALVLLAGDMVRSGRVARRASLEPV